MKRMRGIDHAVLAVRDLDRAAETWGQLGFTLTPRAQHPWGTGNRLVQLDGSFLEILGVDRPDLIVPAETGGFSFGAFNRDFLARREGFSMLVLDSRDADADLADFRARGLPAFPRFDFERIARSPDGAERKVAFSLAFTRIGQGREAGFFTCAQHYPENFWRTDYQRHANGATGIAAVVLVAADPDAHQSALAAFAGSDEVKVTAHGCRIVTARGVLEIMTPGGFERLHGPLDPAVAGADLALAGLRIRVANLAVLRRLLGENGVSTRDDGDTLTVGATDVHGVTVIFAEA